MFIPAWWCRGRHAQTIWGSKSRSASTLPVQRKRWELPDGDFLDVDEVPAAAGSPSLVVLHGLEGSSRSRPVVGLLQAAHQQGWRGFGINFRSCSGEPNRLRRSYHAGETSDLAWVIQRVIAQHPGTVVFCAGFSLGGNVLLKYLGEQGAGGPSELKAAVAISTPFDLAVSVRAMEQGFSRVYMTRLVNKLRRKTLEKLERYPDIADRQALCSIQTVAEFDEVVTAPANGFPNAAAYWTACSSKAFLSKIKRPTLLINAQDDPFFPAAELPREQVAQNPFLRAEFPSTGGHTGFISGGGPGRSTYWAEDRAIAFLVEQLSLMR